MTHRGLLRFTGLYLVALTLASVALSRRFTLRRDPPGIGRAIISDYTAGRRIARHLVDGHCGASDEPGPSDAAVTRIREEIVDAGPILGNGRVAFGVSFAPAKDGINVEYHGQSAWLTPDDLQQLHAYDARLRSGKWTYALGLDRDIAVAALAAQLATTPEELIAGGQFWRIALRKCKAPVAAVPSLTARELDVATEAAGRYLARQLKSDKTFRYELDPFTDQELPGYSWPRHAGATFYLAQIARHTGNPELARAARQAAERMSTTTLLHCGSRRCIGEGNDVNIGSSALALLAFVELVESKIAPEFRPIVFELASFLRSQQRSDGEFMHRFDIEKGQPVDVQQAFFSGEAAFALSRAQRITQDPADLTAAKRALAYLTYRPAWAIAMRYFWGSEHWTCQALEDLWQRAPNAHALEFCLTWQEYNRGDMVNDSEYVGAISGQPYSAIRYTPSASRMEAAVATLRVARLAGVAPSRVEALEAGIRKTLQLLMRIQFLPGPIHLMPSPQQLHGGFPGGNADYRVRIDYPQHAAAALLRYRLLKFPELGTKELGTIER